MNFSSAIKVWKCGAFYVSISFFRFLEMFLVIFLDIDQNFRFQGELAEFKNCSKEGTVHG